MLNLIWLTLKSEFLATICMYLGLPLVVMCIIYGIVRR